MYKKILTVLTTICFVFCSTSLAISLENKSYKENYVLINNLGDNSIKIKVKNIEIVNEPIKIDEKYSASAIITMDVENNGMDNLELANLDVYPYQGNKATKYFVSTEENEIKGFIGYLKGGESKEVKIGVALHNKKEPINIKFSNIENDNYIVTMKSIEIK